MGLGVASAAMVPIRFELGIRALKLTATVVSLLLCLGGCGFVCDEKIVGPYKLVTVDDWDQMEVSYDLRISNVIWTARRRLAHRGGLPAGVTAFNG